MVTNTPKLEAGLVYLMASVMLKRGGAEHPMVRNAALWLSRHGYQEHAERLVKPTPEYVTPCHLRHGRSGL
jgi:hypothetical protein